MSKHNFLEIVRLLSDGLSFFGDRPLHDIQLRDLVDSIFTSAGLIDGVICYVDYIGVLLGHPIIQMLLSPQFQGLRVAKSLNEDIQDQLIESNKIRTEK